MSHWPNMRWWLSHLLKYLEFIILLTIVRVWLSLHNCISPSCVSLYFGPPPPCFFRGVQWPLTVGEAGGVSYPRDPELRLCADASDEAREEQSSELPAPIPMSIDGAVVAPVAMLNLIPRKPSCALPVACADITQAEPGNSHKPRRIHIHGIPSNPESVKGLTLGLN